VAFGTVVLTHDESSCAAAAHRSSPPAKLVVVDTASLHADRAAHFLSENEKTPLAFFGLSLGVLDLPNVPARRKATPC
jgi:hypothetical protein